MNLRGLHGPLHGPWSRPLVVNKGPYLALKSLGFPPTKASSRAFPRSVVKTTSREVARGGEGEEVPWNEAQRNMPRGPIGHKGRGAYANQEYGKKMREEYGNQYQGEVQKGYYNNNQVGEGGGNYYGDQGGNRGRDVGINSIKTSLPPFKGKWFAITWWGYMKRYHLVLQDAHPLPWTGLKALMRVRYVLERYHQELLAKLYNLRQGNKSVVSYYNEFQNLILKLEYTENEEHTVIRFKVGLNKEISSKMTIHKFASLNDIFEVANKDCKKPYGKKPFEGNTPRYPLREESNKDPTKFPTGIQCHKCRGWDPMMRECPNRFNVLVQGGELYLGEGVDQEEGCEEETQEENEFERDEDEEQDPCEGKDVAIPNGLIRKAPIEEACPQE
ncbi:hypothetical protein KY284_026477 [Solanum tuberosum]|nr:hypothetical protein KY284_026477 [Solanum tuberosum]